MFNCCQARQRRHKTESDKPRQLPAEDGRLRHSKMVSRGIRSIKTVGVVAAVLFLISMLPSDSLASEGYWNNEARDLCGWLAVFEERNRLPPLTLCRSVESYSESEIESAIVEWWASLSGRGFYPSAIRSAYTGFKVEKQRREAEQAIRKKNEAERPAFLTAVLELIEKEKKFAAIHTAPECQSDFSTPTETDIIIKKSCDLSKDRSVVVDIAAALAPWEAAYSTDPDAARSLLAVSKFLLDSVISTIEKKEEKRLAAIKARNARQVAEEDLKKQVPSMTSQQLCARYSRGRQKFIREELHRRSAISSKDWTLIDKKSIQIGMTELALLCSIGAGEQRSRSVGSWGTHIQYVYGHGVYVYVENGVVTSWQD